MSGQTTTPNLNIDLWAQGIEEFESGGRKDARNYRNNNPGNLKYAKQFGATGYDKDGFAVFQSYDLGRQALKEQLERNVQRNPNFTLVQHMHQYLGGTGDPKVTKEGDPFAYAEHIAKKMGVDAGAPLTHAVSTGGVKPWAEVASSFDPMMPEETYQELKKIYFDNFISPKLTREDDELTAWKYFDEKTKRPSIIKPEKLMELREVQATASFMHGALAPIAPDEAKRYKEIEEGVSRLQLREGQNPAWEQIPGEMLGSTGPLMAAAEGGEPIAASTVEELFSTIKGAQVAHRALRGGIAFAAYEGMAADHDRGVAALKGFVLGAAMDGGLSLPGKLLKRGVSGNAEELITNAMDPKKGVSLDADRVIADQILQDQRVAKTEGRAAFLKETHDVRGAQANIKMPDGRMVQEPILPNELEKSLSRIQFYTQQGAEVIGIDYQPGWSGKIQEFLALQNKSLETGYTSRVANTEPGKAIETAEALRSQGAPAEPLGDSQVQITQPKKTAPSRDQLREVIAQFGGDESHQQNVINQLRQIWEPKVPPKSKRLMVDKLGEMYGEKINSLLPDEWKVQPKVDGIYSSEFEKWLYSLGSMQSKDILMANASYLSLMSSEGKALGDVVSDREILSELERRLPKGVRVPEQFLPAWLAPKAAGELEAAKAIGNHVPDTAQSVPTLDIEESRGSKMQRLYRIMTGVGYGKGGGVDVAAERLMQDLGFDPYKIDTEELSFAPNFEKFQAELKGYEIIQAAQEEIEGKAAQMSTSVEEASALQEAVRKGEIEPSAVDKRVPPSERGAVVTTAAGPRWVSIHANEARIRIGMHPDILEEFLPGAAGASVAPEFLKFRQDVIARLGVDLDPRDPRPWHIATTPNRDYLWHENLHNGLYNISGKVAGMYNTWVGSPMFNTAEEIAAQLSNHMSYNKMPMSLQIEEAFVHAATAVRIGDVNYLARMAYWDTSIGRVLKMVEDFSERALQDAGLKMDTIPIQQVKRALDHVLTKASSDRMAELVRLGRETNGLAFYEPTEQLWKFVDETGKFRTSQHMGSLVDHLQELAAGGDFAPSASIWAEMRGLRGQMAPRGLQPTNNMPMPEHSLGQDQKWMGWKAMEGAFRPMLPWVADLDTKLNSAFGRTGERLPLYEKVKAVDDALKKGDDWLTNQKEKAADFLKGNPKKLYSYMDALTYESKYWPQVADKLQLDAKDLQNLQRAENWLKDFQNDTHIPAFNYLRDQLPRLRGFNFNPEMVYGRGAKLPSDMSFFHRAISEESLDPKDAHLGRFMNFLIREGFEKKYTGEAISDLKKLVDTKDADGKYILGSTRWPLNNYVNYVRGIPDVSQQVITRMSGDFGRMMGEQFKKVNQYLPEGFKLPEEVNYPGSIFNKLMTLSYVGALGARPAIFIRDVFQAATTTLPVLGLKNFIRGAARGLTSEGFERAEVAGALLNKRNIGEMYGDIFNEMPASGNKFDQALKLSSKLLAPSRWGHNVARAIAFNGEFDSTLEAVQKYRAGLIDADKLMTDTSIWFYDKPEITKMLEMAGDAHVPAEDVAHRSALQLVDLTLWPYRRGAQPTLLRTGAGRIFGQFGMWPLNYMDFLRRLATKVSDFHGPALRSIGTWVAANYTAATLLEKAFHADVGKWFFLSPSGFGGSPHLELVQNLMKMPEETQEGREARRKVMEYPLDFVPTSNELKSVIKSMDDGHFAFTEDGHLSDGFTQILGFRPLNETHQQRLEDLTFEERTRYELGYPARPKEK